MKQIFYYQPVIIPIAKNGSNAFGVNAVTQIWSSDSLRKMELSVFGKDATEALEKLNNSLTGDETEFTELKCEYYLCSEVVESLFKPFEVSKPFQSGYTFDKRKFYYVAWLNLNEVQNYYTEKVQPHNEKAEPAKQIDFWLEECVLGSMNVLEINLKAAKKNGLFVEIENQLSITKDNNRAMTIANLSQRFGITPVQLINKNVV